MAAAPKRKTRARGGRTARRANAPLDVARGSTRRQEIQDGGPNASSRTPGDTLAPSFPGPEFMQLMNRRAQTFAELPLRIALSRTPFEVWRHQNQFMQDIIDDCEFATLCLLKVALAPFSKRPT